MEKHITKSTYRTYEALLQQAMDRYIELDPDQFPLYEVYFSGFHLDLFYFAGLQLHRDGSQPHDSI